jgi:hypothetical protein
VYKIIGGDGEEYGPVDAERIEEWIKVNRVNGETFAQPVGRADWQPLSTFPEFAPHLVASPPPLPTTAYSQSSTSQNIPSYLVPAILCTLLCCPLMGAPAIAYAMQVNKKQSEGNLAGAQAASTKARIWCWLAVAFAVLSSILGSIVARKILP